jgi:polyvinyl alcohol dehydrogenase (cytochrome)
MRRCVGMLLWILISARLALATGVPVTGMWRGTVHIGGEDYRIVLHIDGSSAATLDSPDTGKLGIPLSSVNASDGALSFELPNLKGSFHGKLTTDQRLTGEWKQSKQTTALTLERVTQIPKFDDDGSYLFHSRCTSCHTAFNPMRAPWPENLKLIPQTAVLGALETGKMSSVGAAMTHEQRVAVAAYLGRNEKQGASISNTCKADVPPMDKSVLWNGWSGDLSNSRFQPAELAGLTKAQVSRLRVKWAFGYAGANSAGGPPSIVGGRIFVAGADGAVYSLDMHSGCMYWRFATSALTRTAITISEDGATAYFGDAQARAYAVSTATGALLWKTDLDSHAFAMITGAPKLYGDRLFVPVSSAEELAGANPKYPCCTFRGSVSALDAKTGAIAWKTYTIANEAKPSGTSAVGTQMFGPSGAGVWSSPTIDPNRHALYVGTGDNYSDPGSETSDAVVALNLDDGKILWIKQLTADDRFNIGCMAEDKSSCPKNPGGDFDIGAPPILRKLANGKSLLIVGQKSGVVYGLDPDAKGATLWESRIGKGGPLGGIEFGGAATESRVYFPLSDWSPDPKTGGGLFALDLANGQKVWSSPAPEPGCLGKGGCSASQPAPATASSGVIFSGSLDGHLRAYDESDGKVLWDFDTARDFPSVNGVKAHGGSINYAGTVVAGGMLFTTSGYSINAGMAGNVLLALSVDGK